MYSNNRMKQKYCHQATHSYLISIHEWFYYMSVHLKQILFGIKLTIKLTNNLQNKISL